MCSQRLRGIPAAVTIPSRILRGTWKAHATAELFFARSSLLAVNWPVRRIHAGEIEWVVIEQLRILLTTPEIIFGHLEQFPR